MNLKPWLVYAQKTLGELHIPEDAFTSMIADLAESWIGQLAGEVKPDVSVAEGGAAATAATASPLILSPPDDIPLSEAILHLSAFQLQPEHQTHKQDSGQYFTPLDLAGNLLNATAHIETVPSKISHTEIVPTEIERPEFSDSRFTVLDPACGSGVFLYAATHLTAQVAAPDKIDTARKRAAFVRDSLFGIEKDPLVARLARATLTAWILEGSGVGIDISEATHIAATKIICGDALLGDAWRSHHFDYVVGNPPFLGIRRGRIPNSEKAALQNRFQTAQGQFDLYAIFVEDALTRIKEGGSIAFVLPRPLLSNDYSAPLRQLLAKQTTIHDILDFGKPFQAGVEIIGLIASRRPETSPESAVAVKSEAAISPACPDSARTGQRANNARIHALPVMLFHTPENDLVGLVARLATEFPPLGDLTVSWRGLEYGKKNAAITESRISSDALPILRGSDVQRYAIQSPTRYYSPTGEFSMACKEKLGWRALSNRFPAGKLLVRRVFPGLAAAYDPDPNLTLNTIYVLMAKSDCTTAPDFSYLPWFLLGVINSGIASFWFKNAFIFRESLFPYVRLSQLRRLPCPPPDHPHAVQLAELARMISLAHQKSSTPNCEVLQQNEKHIEDLLADMLALSDSERSLIQTSRSFI